MWQKINEKLLNELTENAMLRSEGNIFFPQNIDKENRCLEFVSESQVSPDSFSAVYGNKLGDFVGKASFDRLLSEGWEVNMDEPRL